MPPQLNWKLYRRDLVEGLRDSIPLVVASAPFGMLFGVLAIDNGFTVGEAVLMSVAVYAGASQIVGIDLFGQNAAPWLIVLSIFAVNFRITLYSAGMVRTVRSWRLPAKLSGLFLLTDMNYALAEAHLQTRGPVGIVWYFTVSLIAYLTWILDTWIGAVFGRMIRDPHAWGMDFVVTIFFFSLALGFRKRRGWLAVTLASAAGSMIADATVGSPWHVSIGAISGISAAVLLPRQATVRGGDDE